MTAKLSRMMRGRPRFSTDSVENMAKLHHYCQGVSLDHTLRGQKLALKISVFGHMSHLIFGQELENPVSALQHLIVEKLA